MSSGDRESSDEGTDLSKLPVPQEERKKERRRNISLIWLLPVIAALMGAYLAYRALSQRGPEIEIVFDQAEGIDAGRTRIKHKHVDVGDVTEVRLSKDLKQVIVTARMVREIQPYLTHHTRFWIVRARVSAGKVAALGTLVSGAYIAIDPIRVGQPTRHFKGLEKPPPVTTGLKGRRFRLIAESLGSVSIGTPVYYRQIEAGEVIDFRLEGSERLAIDVFIRAPYHQYVNTRTRFWHASGIDASIDATGLHISSVALAALLTGGVAFTTPEHQEAGPPAPENMVFRLHRDNRAIEEPLSEQPIAYLVRFTGSVRGLSRNAPVEFRGIKVGRVVDVWLELDRHRTQLVLPVLLEIEPGQFAPVQSQQDGEELIAGLVKHGLRARLKQVNMVMAQLYVDLDFDLGTPPGRIERHGRFLVLPTSASPGSELTGALTQFVERLSDIDLKSISKNLAGAAGGARRLLDNPELILAISEFGRTLRKTQTVLDQLGSRVAPQVASAVERLRHMIDSLGGMVASGSPMRVETEAIVLELRRTMRSVRALTEYLERHPEALLRGKENH